MATGKMKNWEGVKNWMGERKKSEIFCCTLTLCNINQKNSLCNDKLNYQQFRSFIFGLIHEFPTQYTLVDMTTNYID